MFADLWKDFLRRFWWGILAVLVLIGGVIWWYISSQTVVVSGYHVSPADAEASQYYLAGEINKAQSAYEKITQQHSGDWFAWNNLGNIYRDKNQYANAESAYLKAVNVNPKFEQAYHNLYGLYYVWAQEDKTKLKSMETVLLSGFNDLPKSELILGDLLDYYTQVGDQQNFKKYQDKLDQLRNNRPNPQN